jgi:hypothetical protein
VEVVSWVAEALGGGTVAGKAAEMDTVEVVAWVHARTEVVVAGTVVQEEAGFAVADTVAAAAAGEWEPDVSTCPPVLSSHLSARRERQDFYRKLSVAAGMPGVQAMVVVEARGAFRSDN